MNEIGFTECHPHQRLSRPQWRKVSVRLTAPDTTRWRAIAVPFGKDDHQIYAEKSVTDLMKAACAFAVENHPERADNPDPSRMVLAYISAVGSNLLFEGFGASAFPLSLKHPDWRWKDGEHWRFDIIEVMGMLRRGLRTIETGTNEALRQRLEAHGLDDALLLPSRNFMVAKTEPIRDLYLAFLSGRATVGEIDQAVSRKKYGRGALKRFYARTGGKKKTFAYDSRDLVFAKARVGQDGGHHEIDPGEVLTADRMRRELEGRFRFGVPLSPPGFQHDVQWEHGSDLVREVLFCIDRGAVEVSGDHANVFANDKITAETMKTLEAEK